MDEQERWQVDGGGSMAYQRFLVPLVTAKWAAVLADRVAFRPGDRVLDIACGTGAVTRVAAERVGACGHVTGLDINPEMLAVGRSLPAVEGGQIEWIEGSAGALPFADGSFDAIVCQLGLQFFPRGRAALPAGGAHCPGRSGVRRVRLRRPPGCRGFPRTRETARKRAG